MTKIAKTTDTVTTGEAEALLRYRLFVSAAKGDRKAANETIYVRNVAYNEIFRDYWCDPSVRGGIVSIKVYAKIDGDAKNKMIFTAHTGAKLTVYERR